MLQAPQPGRLCRGDGLGGAVRRHEAVPQQGGAGAARPEAPPPRGDQGLALQNHTLDCQCHTAVTTDADDCDAVVVCS